MTASYRAWLLALAKREAEDCRRLRGVLSERPQVVVEATRNWTATRREALLSGLAKGCNLGIEPLALSADEATELKKWSWAPTDRNTAHMRAALLVGISRRDFHVDRQKLRRTLQRVLRKSLGRCSRRPGELCFISKLDRVTVNTFVDTGGWWQLRYWQTVVRGEFDEPPPLMSDAIVLPDVGVSHLVGEGITHWDAMKDDDIERVADHVGALCAEFVEAVPQIVRAA